MKLTKNRKKCDLGGRVILEVKLNDHGELESLDDLKILTLLTSSGPHECALAIFDDEKKVAKFSKAVPLALFRGHKWDHMRISQEPEKRPLQFSPPRTPGGLLGPLWEDVSR